METAAKKSFWDIINSGKPVLVDFYADWCGPCKMMSPVIDKLKSEIGDKAIILKVNVDLAPAASAKYQISGVPTFILFKSGSIVWRQSGGMSLEQLKQLLSRAL